MRQRGGEADLAQEPLAAERFGEVRMEQLDRDGALVLQVAREVDRRHAARAQLALDHVAVRQRLRQVGVMHGRNMQRGARGRERLRRAHRVLRIARLTMP